jgi:hypothetical protein
MQIRYQLQAEIKPVLIQPHSPRSPVFIDPAFPSDFTVLQSFCCAVVNADSLMQLVGSKGGLGSPAPGVLPPIATHGPIRRQPSHTVQGARRASWQECMFEPTLRVSRTPGRTQEEHRSA